MTLLAGFLLPGEPQLTVSEPLLCWMPTYARGKTHCHLLSIFQCQYVWRGTNVCHIMATNIIRFCPGWWQYKTGLSWNFSMWRNFSRYRRTLSFVIPLPTIYCDATQRQVLCSLRTSLKVFWVSSPICWPGIWFFFLSVPVISSISWCLQCL